MTQLYKIEEILEMLQAQIYLSQGRYLTTQEEEILKGTWQNLSYEKIADSLYLSDGYIRALASELWHLLSDIFGQKITKPQFRYVITNLLKSDTLDIDNTNDDIDDIDQPKKGHILIIDDEGESFQLISRLFKKNGYQVSVFNNSQAGLKFIMEEQSIDLILLDIIRPDLNGYDYDFCKKIKSNPILNDIPVIFISSFNDSENKIQALKLGANDYITKPFNLDEILLRVEHHINCYKKQLELHQKIEDYERKLYLLGWVGGD